MKKYAPLITWIIAVSTLEFYFMNYIMPQLNAADFKAATDASKLEPEARTLQVNNKPIEQRVYQYKSKKYVWIESKWYYYNTDHVYYIEKTPTLFIHNKLPYPEPKQIDAGQVVVDHDALTALNTMMAKNPFQVYTPDGFKTLMSGVKAAQQGAAYQKQALEKTLEQ